MEELGIVLKSFYPYKYKLSVLAQHSGKLNVMINPTPLASQFAPGTLVRFFTHEGMQSTVIPQVEILNIPVFTMSEHIYWLHHLLEICYYFLPLGLGSEELFQLVQYAFELSDHDELFKPYFRLVKKVCLTRVMISFGFYPTEQLSYVIKLFEEVVMVSLDSSNAQKVRLLQRSFKSVTKTMEKEIDTWLLSCVHDHPQAAQFKTLSFFHSM